MAKSWDKANEIASALSNKLGHTFRLVTEAEWEYVSIMPQYENIFERDKHFEWCSDFYSEEYPKEEQINPTGPIKEKDMSSDHLMQGGTSGKETFLFKQTTMMLSHKLGLPLV